MSAHHCYSLAKSYNYSCQTLQYVIQGAIKCPYAAPSKYAQFLLLRLIEGLTETGVISTLLI